MLSRLPFVGIALLAACYPAAPETSRSGLPQTEAACEAKGGDWRRAGMVGQWMCIMPYSDAGEACRDTSDCQGLCLYELEGRRAGDASTGERVTGFCQPESNPFGCRATVKDGVLQPAICID